jgi:hypothetical protein
MILAKTVPRLEKYCVFFILCASIRNSAPGGKLFFARRAAVIGATFAGKDLFNNQQRC